MANISVPVFQNNWTIAGQLEKSQETREKWDKQFTENRKEMEDALTTSIAQESLKVIETFYSPYKALPDVAKPNWTSHSLSFEKDNLQRLAPAQTNLPPFAAWRDYLDKAPLGTNRLSYFRNNLNNIGSEVARKVNSLLTRQYPQNSGLQLTTLWDAVPPGLPPLIPPQRITTSITITDDSSSTLSEKKKRRNEIREIWDKNFEENGKTVASRIGDSIALDILNSFGTAIADPLRSPSSPFLKPFFYVVDIRKNGELMAKFAQESAALPPFNQWLSYFQNFPEGDESYFSQKENFLRGKVREKINSHLQDFQNNPANQNVAFQLYPENTNLIRGVISYSPAKSE